MPAFFSWVAITQRILWNFQVFKMKQSCVLGSVCCCGGRSGTGCFLPMSSKQEHAAAAEECWDLRPCVLFLHVCSTSSKVGKFDFGEPYPEIHPETGQGNISFLLILMYFVHFSILPWAQQARWCKRWTNISGHPESKTCKIFRFWWLRRFTPPSGSMFQENSTKDARSWSKTFGDMQRHCVRNEDKALNRQNVSSNPANADPANLLRNREGRTSAENYGMLSIKTHRWIHIVDISSFQKLFSHHFIIHHPFLRAARVRKQWISHNDSQTWSKTLPFHHPSWFRYQGQSHFWESSQHAEPVLLGDDSTFSKSWTANIDRP